MAYTRTWDASYETSPADADNVSDGAGKIRTLKTDIRERVAKDHYMDVAGTDADHGEHSKVTLREQAAAPSNVANKGFLYTKDYSGTTELYYRDSEGNESRITTAGAVGSTPNTIAYDANNKSVASNGAITDTVAGTAQVKTTDGTVEPITHNDIDLGASAKAFKNLYIAGVIIEGGNTQPHRKVIDIGDWNMDLTSGVSVAHGLTLSKIRNVSVLVRNDAATFVSSLGYSSNGVSAGTWSVDATYVILGRTTSGSFDGSTFSATGFNRGWITIDYVD